MNTKFLIVLMIEVLFYLPTFAQNNGKKPLRAKSDLITDYYRIDWVNASGGTIVIGDKDVSTNTKRRNAIFKSTDIVWWKNDKQAIKVHNIKSHEYERLTRGEMAKYGTKSIYDYYVKKHKLESKGGLPDIHNIEDLSNVELYMINDTVQIDMYPLDILPKGNSHYFVLKYVSDSYEEVISIPLTTIIDGCLCFTKNDLITSKISTSSDAIEFFSLEYYDNDWGMTIINNLKVNILR